MKKVIFALISFYAVFSYSQTKEQDSLAIALAFKAQDSAKVETSLALIKSLYNSNDFSKALQYATQTEKISNKINYKVSSAEIHYYKALIFTHRDDYLNAVMSYDRAKTLYTSLDDSLYVARIDNNIGLLEIKRGNYDKGLKLSESAIKLLEQANLRQDLSVAYSNLAEAYYYSNRTEKALEFNKKALSIQEELNDADGIKQSSNNIASLYSKRKEHSKAIEYYNKTLNILKAPKDNSLKAEILPIIGEEYIHYREYKKATDYLINGLRLNKKLNNAHGISKSYNALALLNFKLKKYKLSYSQLDKALLLINKDKDSLNHVELLKNYKYRMQTDSALKRYQNAFYWQSKFYTLKQELPQEETLIAKAEPQTTSSIKDIPEENSNSVVKGITNTPKKETSAETQKTLIRSY